MAKARAAARISPRCPTAAPRPVLAAFLWLVAGVAGAQDGEAGFELDPDALSSGTAPCSYAHNRGVDIIAEYLDGQGQVAWRSGSWLGRDGRYLLPAPGPDITRVRFRTLDAARAERQDVEIAPCPADLPLAGIEALSSALNTRLGVYLWETAAPDHLTDRFVEAIEAFENAGSLHWAAVAHFEYAAFSRSRDRIATAASHYEAARSAFDGLGDDRGKAAALLSLSLVAMRRGDNDASAQRLEQAIGLFETLGDWQSLAGAANNLGLLDMRRGRLDEAAFHFERSLTLRSGPLNLRAPDVAELSAEALAQVADLTWALNTLNNLALVRRRQGAVDLAEQYWRNYLALAEHIDRSLGIAQVQHNLGSLMLRQGRLDEALVLLGRALERFSAGKERRWLVESRLNLSLLYHRLSDDALALEHARKAAALSPEDRDTRVRALRHLAELERRQGRLGEALALYDEALAVFDAQQEEPERWITESERGQVLLLQGDFEPARAIQQDLLDRLPDDEQLVLAALLRYRLALGWLHDDQSERARPLLESALSAFRASGDIYFELLALEALAEALASSPQAQLDYSRQAFDRGFELRRQPLADARRVGVAATLKRIDDGHVRRLVAQGRIDEAWSTAEQIRSATLLQGQRSRRRSRDEGRRALLDRHAELMDRLHRARLDESTGTSAGAVDTADLRLRIDTIESRLQDGPVAAGAARSIGRDEVARSLAPRHLLLSYYQLPDRLLLWATANEDEHFVAIENIDEISERIDALLERLRHPRHAIGAIDQLARDLGTRLLAPVSDLIDSSETLLVQPHGDLHALPFAVLIKDDRLLIDHWTVEQVVSMSAPAGAATSARKTRRRLLVLADPGWQGENRTLAGLPEQSLAGRLVRDGVMARLPGTAREAQALLALESAGVDVRLRTGRSASRQFLTAGGLRYYSLLHFATHGLVDMRYPSLSALLLADAEGFGPALLRPSEIASLDIDAELVVLSGCETGAGPIPSGDGALSLARPFLIAGAERVVSTLWKIDDARTGAFMAAFYRHLIDNDQDPAGALAAAQRGMRRDRATAHPYFWAGFTLAGLNMPD